jgi:RNA methyltransferase, TrmH family
MLSKANIKFIKSLQVKKYRKQEQCFVVEGAKSVQELLDSDFEVRTVYGTSKFLSTARIPSSVKIEEASEAELASAGEFQSNNTVLAIAKIKPNITVTVDNGEFALVLDDIRDPGNLGTVIRTADWYGVTKIIASEETADFYNSKVITSTMGSFTRVKMFYTDLSAYLSQVVAPVFGAYLQGENVHRKSFAGGGYILIGNESRGIAEELEKFVTEKITIPKFGGAESLNAAIATAVILDNIRRHRPDS